jgi:hypothetical protein
LLFWKLAHDFRRTQALVDESQNASRALARVRTCDRAQRSDGSDMLQGEREICVGRCGRAYEVFWENDLILSLECRVCQDSPSQ